MNKYYTLTAIASIALAGIVVFTSPTSSPVAPTTIAEITEVNSQGTAELVLTPPTGDNIIPNSEISLSLVLSSPDLKTTGVDLYLSYDPTILSFVSLSPSSLYPTVLLNPIVESGVIHAVYGASLSSGGVSGTNLFANLKFRTLVPGTTEVKILETTNVTAIGQEINVLKSVDSASFTINPPPTANPSTRISCRPVVYKMPYTINNLPSPMSTTASDYLKPEYRINTEATSVALANPGDIFVYGLEVTNTTNSRLTTTGHSLSFIAKPATAQDNNFQYITHTAADCSSIDYNTNSCFAEPLNLAGNQSQILTKPFILTRIDQNNSSQETSTFNFTYSGKDCGNFTIQTAIALAGDLTGDGHVTLADFNRLIANYGNPYTLADFNNIIKNYGR